MHGLVVDRNDTGIEIDDQLPGPDCRFRVSLRPAHDRLYARDQLPPVKGLRQEVVGAEPQPLDLVVQLGQTRKDQDRRADPRGAQSPEHLVAVDVRQHQIEENDIVIVEFADL